MVGQLIKSVYKYDKITLASGAIVTANEVTIKSNKVTQIINGVVTVDKQSFSFSVYPSGGDGKLQYNLTNVPAEIDGQEIVAEFITFVEADVLS